MIIQSLHLLNFRNYKDVLLQFDDGIHMLIGKNGQGKTNVLESIYYLSCTKSHRTKDDRDLIMKNESFFLLDGLIYKKNKKINIKCSLNENGKNLFLYKNPVHKVSDFIGVFNAVMFCPDDLNLFSAAPRVRRKFMDLELGKLSITYTNTLNVYYKLLKERNTYLKSSNIDIVFLELLEDQLIDLQIMIVKQRIHFLENINKYAHEFYNQLADNSCDITFNYQSDVVYDSDDKKMKELLKIKYKKNRDRDIFLKQTSIGIHKDDFSFYLNKEEINSFASQGQKRILALSLKLGIVYSIHHVLKEYPVLILDDVFSELDYERREKLLMLLPNDIQIFISTTDEIKVDSSKNIKYWMVNNGMIEMMRRK